MSSTHKVPRISIQGETQKTTGFDHRLLIERQSVRPATTRTIRGVCDGIQMAIWTTVTRMAETFYFEQTLFFRAIESLLWKPSTPFEASAIRQRM